MCVWTRFPREVAFILCPFSAATWWESCERDTIPPSSRQTESPFSTPEGRRERPSVSACELRGERWPLTLTNATEVERGQACVHLPPIILALSLIWPFFGAATRKPESELHVLDVDLDQKWHKGVLFFYSCIVALGALITLWKFSSIQACWNLDLLVDSWSFSPHLSLLSHRHHSGSGSRRWKMENIKNQSDSKTRLTSCTFFSFAFDIFSDIFHLFLLFWWLVSSPINTPFPRGFTSFNTEHQ